MGDGGGSLVEGTVKLVLKPQLLASKRCQASCEAPGIDFQFLDFRR